MNAEVQLNSTYDRHNAPPIKIDLHPTQRFVSTITQPYFYREDIEQPVYKLRDPALRNAPTTPPALAVWAEYNYMGARVTIGRVVHEGPQPVEIVPGVSLGLSSHAQVLPPEEPSVHLTTKIRATTSVQALGGVMLFVENGKSNRKIIANNLPSESKTSKATEESVAFTIDRNKLPGQSSVLQAVVTEYHKDYTEGYRAVGYNGIPSTNFYTPATDRIVPVDLKLPAKHKLAYLPGTGDAVPEALASIGLAATVLTVADLTPTKLAQYDTIILGVRTYAAHPDLHGAPTQALLDYAKSGGNVVVQYQTGEFTAADAPYPLAVGNAAERVIDETDPVQLLAPDSTLLTTPNKITPADFDNWIEERGHGFLRSYDDHYTALTETHDPGDPPQRGGLVTVQLGKGRWTYCAYALYRQLPEAVPGAFRLFVNLINP